MVTIKNIINTQIHIKDESISSLRVGNIDYISLTDIAKRKNAKEPSDVIKKWFSNYDTIEYLGLWEELNNENFNWRNSAKLKLKLLANHLL